MTLSFVSFSPPLYLSPVNGVSRLTYFNIWHGGPPGSWTNRPTRQVRGSQAAQSAPRLRAGTDFRHRTTPLKACIYTTFTLMRFKLRFSAVLLIFCRGGRLWLYCGRRRKVFVLTTVNTVPSRYFLRLFVILQSQRTAVFTAQFGKCMALTCFNGQSPLWVTCYSEARFVELRTLGEPKSARCSILLELAIFSDVTRESVRQTTWPMIDSFVWLWRQLCWRWRQTAAKLRKSHSFAPCYWRDTRRKYRPTSRRFHLVPNGIWNRYITFVTSVEY